MFTAKLHVFTAKCDIDFITNYGCTKTLTIRTESLLQAKRIATKLMPAETERILVLYQGTGTGEDEIILAYKQKNWVNV